MKRKNKYITDISKQLEIFGYKTNEEIRKSLEFIIYWTLIGIDVHTPVEIKIEKTENEIILLESNYGTISNIASFKIERKWLIW